MPSLVDKIRRSLARDSGLPLPERLKKGARYLLATASAPLHLRGCSTVGLRPRTIGQPHIDNRGRIDLGDDVVLNSTYSPVELVAAPGGTIALGSGVALNFGTAIAAQGSVRVGDRVSFGPYCIVSDSDEPGAAARPIEIGEGAWLAGRVTVLPGARIGKGSVIAAGSVVSGEIPAGVVAGGIPARVLRRINGEEGPQSASPAPAAAAVPPEAPRAQPAFTGVIAADFTAHELSTALLSADELPIASAEVAPFGQVAQALLQPAARGDFVVVWTRPEAALPSFGKLLRGEPASEEQLLAEVDAHVALIEQGLQNYRFAFVPTWTVPPWQRGLGMRDAKAGGLWRALALANLRLSDAFQDLAAVQVLPADRWLLAAGADACTPKLWHLGKVPFGSAVFAEAAKDIKAALRGLSGQAKKLVVVDLDDTLWGGTVGEVGWQGLKLGGHDAAGEALVDFQRGLKALTRRGVVLAIASKNEEAVALEAIANHPEMVLRREDFVGHRINWGDKAQNIADLARELNLGLSSVVFLDDNPVERARVREALPEVLVPDWPEDKLLYPSALAALRCFDAPAQSQEDARRTALYAEEKQREVLRQSAGSLDEWLRSLGTRVRAERLSAANLTRAAQLFNKTNQLSLSTRRLTEAELSAWAAGQGRELWCFTVADRFGDAGLTGIASLEVRGDRAEVVDFLLSCRVMGRRVEESILRLLVARARALGAARLEAELLPTAKNKPCLDFWRRSGLIEIVERRFAWDCAAEYPLPDAVELIS